MVVFVYLIVNSAIKQGRDYYLGIMVLKNKDRKTAMKWDIYWRLISKGL